MTSCRRTTLRASSSLPSTCAPCRRKRGPSCGARNVISDMNLNATYVFHAPVERAWNLLMDTKAIGSCLPGCRGLQPAGDDRYEVELGVAVAAISGNFTGTV